MRTHRRLFCTKALGLVLRAMTHSGSEKLCCVDLPVSGVFWSENLPFLTVFLEVLRRKIEAQPVCHSHVYTNEESSHCMFRKSYVLEEPTVNLQSNQRRCQSHPTVTF